MRERGRELERAPTGGTPQNAVEKFAFSAAHNKIKICHKALPACHAHSAHSPQAPTRIGSREKPERCVKKSSHSKGLNDDTHTQRHTYPDRHTATATHTHTHTHKGTHALMNPAATFAQGERDAATLHVPQKTSSSPASSWSCGKGSRHCASNNSDYLIP